MLCMQIQRKGALNNSIAYLLLALNVLQFRKIIHYRVRAYNRRKNKLLLIQCAASFTRKVSL